tara:strand:+ start:211 stop:345 length:135 start_codon:yes stop_codon:yes gene_type:complete
LKLYYYRHITPIARSFGKAGTRGGGGGLRLRHPLLLPSAVEGGQ